MGKRRRTMEECELNMTPMIDVVFQLIIFFIVTINLAKDKNKDIQLEEGKYGRDMIDPDADMAVSSSSLVVEIDRRGNLSIANAQLTKPMLQGIIQRRRRQFGDFPIMIRADYRTEHWHVANVLNLCASLGFARVSFVAIKDPREEASIEYQNARKKRGR